MSDETRPLKNNQTSCVFPPELVFGLGPTSISFSGGTPTGPGFEKNFVLKVPAGNIYTISVSADDFARVSGAGVSVESYWDAKNKRIVPGFATSAYTEIAENAEDVLFFVDYKNNGGPYSLSATVTSIRSGVTNVIHPLHITDTSCLLQHVYTFKEPFINFCFNQFLEQLGVSVPARLPWEPNQVNSQAWDVSVIPPTVIYSEGDLSVRAGVGVDLSNKAATFDVDVFRGGTRTNLSVGIQIDTNGNASANVKF